MGYSLNQRGRRTLRVVNKSSTPGIYYVTICTQENQNFFGTIAQGQMKLNRDGLVAQEVWDSLSKRFPGVQSDQSVIMPNHVHALLIIEATQALIRENHRIERMPERFKAYWENQQSQEPEPYCAALGEVMRTFKAATSRQIHKLGMQRFEWEPRYYSSIVFDEAKIAELRTYILTNPAHWEEDKLYRP